MGGGRGLLDAAVGAAGAAARHPHRTAGPAPVHPVRGTAAGRAGVLHPQGDRLGAAGDLAARPGAGRVLDPGASPGDVGRDVPRGRATAAACRGRATEERPLIQPGDAPETVRGVRGRLGRGGGETVRSKYSAVLLLKWNGGGHERRSEVLT